jgi:predicted nicotinamide N-methyase
MGHTGPIVPEHDPHWSALWPSSLALADAILKADIPVKGTSVLELGCGLGLASIAAALAGAQVTATDIDARALEFTRANAELNGVNAQIETRRLDWRDAYQRKHGVILAADCLYDADAAPCLARLIAAALDDRPVARAFVVDPERHTARNFSLHLREYGLDVRAYSRTAPFVDALGPIGGVGREVPALTRNGACIDVTFYEVSRAR